MRVSSLTQNTARQEVLMQELGVERVFIDRQSGKDTSRPELKREYLLQRQKEGIAIAKQEGKYKGRKPAVRPGLDAVITSWESGEITAVEAMKRLEVSKTTFYRIIGERNIQRKKG